MKAGTSLTCLGRIAALLLLMIGSSAGATEAERTGGKQGSGTTDPSVGTTRGMSDTTSRSHMKENKDLFVKASVDQDHSALVDAIRTAKLESTLRGAGPYTVFAPTNEAFGELPDGTVSELAKAPEGKNLKTLMSYHIVKGRYDFATLKKAIEESPNRRAELVTLEGLKLYATRDGDQIVLQDTQGTKARIVDRDQYAKNGVIHDIDHVVQPDRLSERKPMTRGPIFGE